MKLYLGSRDYCPEGFITVDIDPKNSPDIVADVVDLHMIEDESVDEIVASALLEHLPWPISYKAMAEWTRVLKFGGVLKINIPDLDMLCSLIVRGISTHYAIGMLYGLGRGYNKFEAHQFGYTKNMLLDMLKVLGFSDFDVWNSSISDASNGWMYTDWDEKYALNFNVSGIKKYPEFINSEKLYSALNMNPGEPFLKICSQCCENNDFPSYDTADKQILDMLYQKMHFNFIDAQQRIKYLEEKLNKKKRIKLW